MPTINRKQNVFDTTQGDEITEILHAMEADEAFVTVESYAANGVKYPGNTMTFFEKHRDYILAHPAMDPKAYLSNLRLKTRLR
jgi:hypothetical protein